MKKSDNHSKIVLAIVGIVLVVVVALLILNSKPNKARVGAAQQSLTCNANVLSIYGSGDPTDCGSFDMTILILVGEKKAQCKYCIQFYQDACRKELSKDSTKEKAKEECNRICSTDPDTVLRGCKAGYVLGDPFESYVNTVCTETESKLYDSSGTVIQIVITESAVDCSIKYRCYCYKEKVKTTRSDK